MQKHTRIYLRYFDLGEQDIITCEAGLEQGRIDGEGFDIHHIHGRGKGKDIIKNLMCLCLKHLTMADGMSKDELQLIHNCFLSGIRKRFIK